MSNITLYGIKNCDTIKKAKKWLEQNQIDFTFHDYRVDGLERAWLESMIAQFGWQQVLNKRGTTYRQLPEETRQNLDEAMAVEALLAQPAMIKRPILTGTANPVLGFKADSYAKVFETE